MCRLVLCIEYRKILYVAGELKWYCRFSELV